MKTIHGMSIVDFEVLVAKKYTNKVLSSKERNIEFSLTLSQFRKLLTRRYCAYTGLPLSIHSGYNNSPRGLDLTIERVDSSKGYVHGNVISVCADANSLKSVLENPKSGLKVEHAIRMFSNIEKMLNSAK